MGDGSVTIRKERPGHFHYTVYFYPDDKEMLLAFLDAYQTMFGKSPHVKRAKNFYRVRADSKSAVIDLLQYGSHRSLEWRIPMVFKQHRVQS